MKTGVRALGIAESYRSEQSTLCGAVATTTGVVDSFVFETCTVGGLDATDAIIRCWETTDREDVRYVFIAGVALAWFNIVDVDQLATAIEVPTFLLTFEESEGLDDALAAEFDGRALERRRARYASLPARTRVALPGGDCFLRVVGPSPDNPGDVVRSFTRDQGRPEPVRIARLAARAANRWAHRQSESL